MTSSFFLSRKSPLKFEHLVFPISFWFSSDEKQFFKLDIYSDKRLPGCQMRQICWHELLRWLPDKTLISEQKSYSLKSHIQTEPRRSMGIKFKSCSSSRSVSIIQISSHNNCQQQRIKFLNFQGWMKNLEQARNFFCRGLVWLFLSNKNRFG